MELLWHSDDIQERVALAKELGHKEIIIALKKHNQKLLEQCKKLDCKRGILITTINQAQSMKNKYDIILAPAKREFFENKAVTHILEPETLERKDSVHYRRSGLTQVELKLCKQKDKTILATLSSLQNHTVLGRMMQNARFCRKYDVPYHLVSGATTKWQQRAAKDLEAFERELRSSK